MELLRSHDFFNWVVLPCLIFCARICDVSIGTMRIMFVSKGQKLIAPILGFFEVLIWITALTNIIKNLENPLCYIAYAGGFAMGNYIGIRLEEKIAVGKVLLRIITQKNADELIARLTEHQFGVTHVPAQGSRGPVSIIYSVLKRTDLAKAAELIQQCNPQAFYSIEDIKSVSQGVFPVTEHWMPARAVYIHKKHEKKGK